MITQITEDKELMLVYENLLETTKSIESDEYLSKLYGDIARGDIEEFQENYPEIISKYMLNQENKVITQKVIDKLIELNNELMCYNDSNESAIFIEMIADKYNLKSNKTKE